MHSLRWLLTVALLSIPAPASAQTDPAAASQLQAKPLAPAGRRQRALDGLVQMAGPLPRRDNLPPLDVQVLADGEQDGIRRQTISYVAELRADSQPDRVTAILWIPPRSGAQRRAAIVALHPTGPLGKRIVAGEGPRENRNYGIELARRGYVVLAPDYPSFGNLEKYDFHADAHESGTMKAIVNHQRGVDLLAARDDVDPRRIGAIGHSLGGHNAVFLGLVDERVAAIVTSCGWCPFADYKGGDLTGWTSDRYMPLIAERFQKVPARLPCEFTDFIQALAPRAFLTLSPLDDDNFAVAGVARVMPEIEKAYRELGAPENAQARHPACAHDFPPAVRREAYAFLDNALKHQPATLLPASAPALRTKVFIRSTQDGTPQPSYLSVPTDFDSSGPPRPLVISLHSWSGDVEQRNQPLDDLVMAEGWLYLCPNFRGANMQPAACGSLLAQQDILDALDWVEAHYPVDRQRIYLTGSSGGGHMTMLMSGRHADRWTAAMAWVGISDLPAWHERHAGDNYGRMLRESCGGPPGTSPAVDAQYRARSPLTHLAGARKLALHVAAGIHDGHEGSVPIRHTLDAFNVVAQAAGEETVSETEINELSEPNGRLRDPRPEDAAVDESFGRTIYLRRAAGLARVTIFEGGHEDIASATIQWFREHPSRP